MDLLLKLLSLLGIEPEGRIQISNPNAQAAPFEFGQGYMPSQEQLSSPQISPTATPSATPTPSPTDQYGRNPAFANMQVQPIMQQAIERAAQTYGVPPSLLYDIALQESGVNPGARNPMQGVTAAGAFQFNDPTWDTVMKYSQMPGSTLKLPTNDRMDPETAAMAAAYLISKGQLGRWDASRNEGNNQWGKFYDPKELEPYYAQTRGR